MLSVQHELGVPYQPHLAQILQHYLGTHQQISHELCKYTGWKCVKDMGDRGLDCAEKRNP